MSRRGTILKPSAYQFFPLPAREPSDEPPAMIDVDFTQVDWGRNDKPLTIARGWQFYIHERARRMNQDIHRVSLIARYTIDFFGIDTPVETIKRERCNAYADWRLSAGASVLSVRKDLGIYRAMVSHNFKYERVAAVPYIERPEGEGRKRRALTLDEFKKVLALPISYRLRLFLHIAAWTGHRKRAIETLPWERVDLEQRIINFNDPTMRRTKKRRVDGFPIPEELHRRLVAAKERAAIKCPDDRYVIGLGQARDGKTPVSVYNDLKAGATRHRRGRARHRLSLASQDVRDRAHQGGQEPGEDRGADRGQPSDDAQALLAHGLERPARNRRTLKYTPRELN